MTPLGRTIATFTPNRHFQENTLYTAMLLGADASLSTEDVMNPAGESMNVSYQWTFTTGILNLLTPPPVSPLSGCISSPSARSDQGHSKTADWPGFESVVRHSVSR
jgi:hypothetical protein